MKDEIQQIIENNVYAMDEFDNVHTSLGGHGLAADELQRLMCYREVKAFFEGASCYWKRAEWKCIEYFSSKYPESMILEAIEKVKNEQK